MLLYIYCYGRSYAGVPVTKEGLAGTGRRHGAGGIMGRGVSESRGSKLST